MSTQTFYRSMKQDTHATTPKGSGLFRTLVFILPILLATTVSATAGESVDGTTVVGGEVRSYSLYIPTGYAEMETKRAMLAMHPFNPARWNAAAWRDTLIAFADRTGLLLICPDAGPGGNILDETVDTMLATHLLDSLLGVMDVDLGRLYIGGFSMGGAATYVYGLANADRFAGFLVIGAAVNGTGTFSANLEKADGKPFAIIHGSLDSPNRRFTPIVEALQNVRAVVHTKLLAGVGHTVDFPGRNDTLVNCFRWLDSVASAQTMSVGFNERFEGPANRIVATDPARVVVGLDPVSRDGLRLIDLAGKVSAIPFVRLSGREIAVDLSDSTPGTYMLSDPNSKGAAVLVLVR